MASAGNPATCNCGQADAVMDYRLSVQTAERLGALGGDITVDVLPAVGHVINPQVVEAVLRRLDK